MIPAVNFGAAADFALGVEEELLLVNPETHALEHSAVEVLARLAVPPEEGAALPEAFAALLELTSPRQRFARLVVLLEHALEAFILDKELRQRAHGNGKVTPFDRGH